jgi:chlorobactene glucosyltransferase
LVLIALGNLLTFRRLGDYPQTQSEPFVSILVPERNEERNIEACIRSLLNQDYANLEVIVLNDESTDRSGEILEKLGQECPHLKVIEGQPLASGWLGKNWACAQLAEAARGDYLLFTDADTQHHPYTIREAVAAMLASGAALLSGLPRQEMKTWGELVTLPGLAWATFLFPLWASRYLRLPFLSIAIGQFMLFRRDAYLAIGGHAAVRSNVVEDFALARRATRLGWRVVFCDISRRVSCRMYQSFSEVIDGMTKNLFGVFNLPLPIFLFIWLWLLIVFVLPVAGLALYLLGWAIPGFSPTLAIITILISVFLWGVSDWGFNLPVTLAVFYPFSVMILVMIAGRSAWFHNSKHSMSWKGRELAGRGKMEP